MWMPCHSLCQRIRHVTSSDYQNVLYVSLSLFLLIVQLHTHMAYSWQDWFRCLECFWWWQPVKTKSQNICSIGCAIKSSPLKNFTNLSSTLEQWCTSSAPQAKSGPRRVTKWPRSATGKFKIWKIWRIIHCPAEGLPGITAINFATVQIANSQKYSPCFSFFITLLWC